MHKDLRALLHSAEGQSHHVVVIFLDVRGFSSFAKIAESSDAAEFLKSVYTRILDDYFVEADFFKLTGDGMLILSRYQRETLTEVVRNAVATSIRLVEDFPTICDQDPMVNFVVPGGLGIGLARGAATALTSGDKVLDYSGRPLNLASRLMDLARPLGVVFDDTFGLELLDSNLAEAFRSEDVYIKGLAEDEPMTVQVLRESVEVPEFNRHPINRVQQYVEQTERSTLSELIELGRLNHLLKHEPANKEAIVLHVAAPKPTKAGGRSKTMQLTWTFNAEYVLRTKRHYAAVDYPSVTKVLTEGGIKRTWPVRTTIEYPIRATLDNR